MASPTEWKNVDLAIEKTVTQLVSTEWYVDGKAYFASTASPTEEKASFGILSKK